MIAKQIRAWHSAKRRPPELSFASFLVDAVHQGLHVGVSVGEFLGIKLPIAHIVLPTVVERDPDKSQALSGRKCVIYLLGLNLSSIPPGAPDGAESVVGSGGGLEPLFHHEAPVIGECAEVVSLVDGDEGAKRMKAFAGDEGDSFGEADRNPGVRRIRHGYGQGNQLRPRLDGSPSNSNVPPPDVDNRRAATVIAGGEALIILLLKIGVQRQDPVGALLVGAALIRTVNLLA